MCDVCGCGDPNLVSVEVHARLLERNDHGAAHNREHFQRHGLVAINLMGSPGAGKTALLEATARRLGGSRRLTALAGDLATERDDGATATLFSFLGIPALGAAMGLYVLQRGIGGRDAPGVRVPRQSSIDRAIPKLPMTVPH